MYSDILDLFIIYLDFNCLSVI